MRRRSIAIAAAVVVTVGVGAAWAAAPRPATLDARDSSLLVGYYEPHEDIALANLTVADGVYLIEYEAWVRFHSRLPGAVLACGLVDASGRIGYLDDTVFPVPGNGGWTRVGDSATYDIPETTLGLRCSPTAAGPYGIGFRGVSLTAEPIG
jgi:hypothetical protein